MGNDGSSTDWQRVTSLTDQEIDRAIADDRDSYAITIAKIGHLGSRYRYEIIQDREGSWRWQLISHDGQTLAEAAHGVATRQMAHAAIANLRAALLGAALAA